MRASARRMVRGCSHPSARSTDTIWRVWIRLEGLARANQAITARSTLWSYSQQELAGNTTTTCVFAHYAEAPACFILVVNGACGERGDSLRRWKNFITSITQSTRDPAAMQSTHCVRFSGVVENSRFIKPTCVKRKVVSSYKPLILSSV